MRVFVSGPRIGWVRTGFGFNMKIPKRLMMDVPLSAPRRSFIYVVTSDAHQISKVGITTSPIDRLASLQTGSPFKLEFAYVGATQGDGYDIESEVKTLLESKRTSGEWFDVPPEMLIAAIHGVAHRLGQTVAPADPNNTEAGQYQFGDLPFNVRVNICIRETAKLALMCTALGYFLWVMEGRPESTLSFTAVAVGIFILGMVVRFYPHKPKAIES